MPKICYIPKKFGVTPTKIISLANEIIVEYMRKGYSLTIRQLYYQFIARDLFPDDWVNKEGKKNCGENYTKLQGLISTARIAGLVDWNAIVDRTRSMEKNSHWLKPSDILKSTVTNYAIDKWANQPHYVEVWVEKNALAGVLSGPCSGLDVPFFACVGYTSQSAMWEASQRLVQKIGLGKEVHIIHLGDHDPSGIDMSRDIKERLQLFTGGRVHVLRVALNMPQIEMYNPPPNPAKETDARYASYREKFGDTSWELDALSPEVLVDIVNRAVLMFRDEKLWEESLELERRGRLTLETLVAEFPVVVDFLKSKRAADKATKDGF